MERVKLFCRGDCRGEIVLRPEGSRMEVRASMEDPGDGLYRAVLRGERGELMLGVLAPEGERLELCRRLYSRDIEKLGPLQDGEARCSFQFQQTCWRETCCPAQLFRSAFFHSRLGSFGRAWWRRDGTVLLLALPLREDGPFPLEALFCLGRMERVDGIPCVVYAFREEEPILHYSRIT